MRRLQAPLAYCHNGPKRRYEFPEDAERAMFAIREDPAKADRERLPRRTYRCPHCLGYHLSSQPGPA